MLHTTLDVLTACTNLLLYPYTALPQELQFVASHGDTVPLGTCNLIESNCCGYRNAILDFDGTCSGVYQDFVSMRRNLRSCSRLVRHLSPV